MPAWCENSCEGGGRPICNLYNLTTNQQAIRDLAQVMQERGATVVNGLDMLVHQAAAQFELFTATPAPIADMMQAASDAVK